MTINLALPVFTGAPSDPVRPLITRLGNLRADYQHLLESDAYLRDCGITDYTARVRTRIAAIRDEATSISRQLDHLGHPGLAREVLQDWPALRPPGRSTRTHTARARQRHNGVSRRCPRCGIPLRQTHATVHPGGTR